MNRTIAKMSHLWIIWIIAFLMHSWLATCSNPLSVSQISPKSDSLHALGEENLQASFSQEMSEASTSNSPQPNVAGHTSAANGASLTPLSVVESASEIQHSRVERSAMPILHENEHASRIRFVDDEKNHLDGDNDETVASGRYYNHIQPTSSLAGPNQYKGQMTKSERGAKDLSEKSSFLLIGGPRSIPSGSPSRPLASAVNTTSSNNPSIAMPAMAALTAPRPPASNSSNGSGNGNNAPRQNPNPDIQDIITGIVKLLNGKVNVHANTQMQQTPVSRRPYTTRINNRGPPRISEAQPLPIDNYDSYEQQPPPQQQMPYPFDRPEGPIRPFLSGVPIPEQKVPPPPNGNFRPGFVAQQQQNRPPWQRPRPRPPIVMNTNVRPVLTPPPYKFTIPTSSPSLQQDEYYAEDDAPQTTDGNQNGGGSDDSLIGTSHQNQTSTYEVNEHEADLLENEEYPDTNKEELAEELAKKKDKAKKPINAPAPIEPTQSSNIMMTTIIQTESEIRTSQHIPASLLTPSSLSMDSAHLQPSEEAPVRISPSDIHLLETTATPSLKTSAPLKIAATEKSKIGSVVSTKQPLPPQASQAVSPMTPSSFPTFHPRPGIVLDDPEFKPGGHARPHVPTTPLYTNVQPTRVPQHHNRPTQHHQLPQQPQKPQLPPGYGEIFDVTLSAIQGGNGGGHSGLQTVNIKPYGASPPGDIIVSPSGDEGFVSIDGKRTYINLFGEATAAPAKPAIASTSTAAAAHKTPAIRPTQVLPPGVSGTGYVVAEADPSTKQPYATSPQKGAPHAQQSQQTRPQPQQQQTTAARPSGYRPRPQQPPVRIDTCIVGDDTTCDMAQNERCKTDSGVSSCHCRPGYARRKHREPCRRVVSLLMSMRVDRFYDRRIQWDKLLADRNSEPYGHLSYEALRAIDSAMSMTPFSDEFLDATVNKIYKGNAAEGSAGVFVNMTIQLEENTETTRTNIKSEIQKHLLGVVHRRNNNIGNSVLYVDSPAGFISNLQDVDECTSTEWNDCHPEATCTNIWGGFECQCAAGLRDPWADQAHRAGRDCQTCPDSYCNNRGTCSFDATGLQQQCECVGSFYGAQCEVDGEVLFVAVGASVVAVIIIVLTLVCLIMWSRRWHREQKEAMGSPVFGYMAAAGIGTQMKGGQTPYQVSLEERMRWAQIADAMAQSNHYGAEPVGLSRPGSAMYGYPNLQMMSQMASMGTLGPMSLAGTLPIHHVGSLPPVPMPRYGMTLQSRAGMRALENSSSSEEEDRADLLGRSFQVPRPKSRSNGSIANQSGIYYDVDYEPSGGELYGGTTTTTATSINNNGNNNTNNASSANIPMSTYTTGRQQSYFMK